MKTRYLAILAVVAVAFAVFAVAVPMADESDADGVTAVTLDKSVVNLTSGTATVKVMTTGGFGDITVTIADSTKVTGDATVSTTAADTWVSYTITYAAAGSTTVTFTINEKTATLKVITTASIAPVAYGKDATSGLRVIAYDDDVFLIDTNLMTNLENYSDFYVGYNVNSTGETKIGPVSLQNGRQYIAVTPDITESTVVKLYPYESSATALGSVTLTPSATAMTITVHTHHSANFATVNTTTSEVAWSDTNTTVPRNGTHILDSSMDSAFDGSAYGYSLKGFSNTAGNTAIVIDSQPTATIEDIIFAAGDTSGVIDLYAVWEKTVYNIYIYNDSTSAYVQTAADIKIDSDVVANATASTKVEGASFGLLRISQVAAKADQYAYTVTLYKNSNISDSNKVNEDGSEGSYTFLNNGTYKLSVTKNDLYVKIAASTTTPVDTTAFSFGIDKIVNDTVGKVNLSMDVNDYTFKGTEKMSLAGTYYENADDGQRIYGNIANLTLADNTNWKAYGDLADKSTGTGKILNSGVVSLSTDYNSYDLALTLPSSKSIYAAQGFFDVDGDGTYETGDMRTPWSLVSA